eukprot:924571-Prorocentrum_minimum.AAC.5
MTSFYGSSCANNGKGALNTPDEGRGYMPTGWTNQMKGEGIYLQDGPKVFSDPGQPPLETPCRPSPRC